jgi:hypothetical protein
LVVISVSHFRTVEKIFGQSPGKTAGPKSSAPGIDSITDRGHTRDMELPKLAALSGFSLRNKPGSAGSASAFSPQRERGQRTLL